MAGPLREGNAGKIGESGKKVTVKNSAEEKALNDVLRVFKAVYVITVI